MEYVYFIATIFYVVLILKFIEGWIRTPTFKFSNDYSPSLQVTVIIPFCNEKSNIDNLFCTVQKQSYPGSLTQILFVNDHSDDGGEVLLQSLIEGSANMTLIHSVGKGKKSALYAAYAIAKGKLIVTLDADCVVGPNWLRSISAFYEKSNSKLIINPIRIINTGTCFSKMQVVEFQSLVASGAGAAGANFPIMCNGANLAFSNELLNTKNDVLNTAYASGDDMFLLENAKKRYPKQISFLKSKEALAYTEGANNTKEFFRQRSRWASKSVGYTDIAIITTGLIVLLVNMMVFPGVLFAIKMGIWKSVLFLWAAKLFVDSFFLILTSSFFGTQKLLYFILPISLIYPFYVLFSVVAGLLRPKAW